MVLPNVGKLVLDILRRKVRVTPPAPPAPQPAAPPSMTITLHRKAPRPWGVTLPDGRTARVLAHTRSEVRARAKAEFGIPAGGRLPVGAVLTPGVP